MSEPACPRCDATVDPSWKFCQECGEDLAADGADEQPAAHCPDCGGEIGSVNDVEVRAPSGVTVSKPHRMYLCPHCRAVLSVQ